MPPVPVNRVQALVVAPSGQHRRAPLAADLITKLAPVGYDRDARCPLWDLFLMEIMEGKPHLVRFLQRAVGYSLTGDTTERVLFVLYGEGANGKTTFLEIIRSLLGDYARGTPVDTLLIKRSSGANNDVAGLKGSRFVTASESGQGKHLDEAQVKQLTGGDTITARFLYGEWFEFHPQFKIWLATNHKPSIRRTDPAIWDRIRLIPFRVRIPEVRRDKNLREKLCEELPGILSWAIKGCLEWQKQGLGVPDEVREATAAYKDEMDVFGNFVTECCVLEPEAWVKTGDLKQEYNDWARENGERNLPNRKEFADYLKSRSCTSERRNTGRGWLGIRIMTS